MTSTDITTGSGLGVAGYARLKIWQASDLAAFDPYWESYTERARHALLCRPEAPDPVRVIESENLVMDNYLAGLAAGQSPQPTHLALGDGTTAPAATNDSLNNEVYRTVVGQDEPDGMDRLTSTFISQNEANGFAIREIGLTDGDTGGAWQLLTHLVLDPIDQVDEKTSNMTLTIDYVLEYRNL